jgi:hypothetical protein
VYNEDETLFQESARVHNVTVVGSERELQDRLELSAAVGLAEPCALTGSAAERSRLEQAFYSGLSKQINKWSHYVVPYHRHLAKYRGQKVRMLEIGVQNGGSLEMWARYLGPEAEVRVGVASEGTTTHTVTHTHTFFFLFCTGHSNS